MLLPNRHSSSTAYRYGFNGMEKDDELKGEGNSYGATFWEYDSRIGRRWNTDPVVVHWESPYAAFRNNPVLLNDPNGDCPDCPDGKYKIQKGDNFWDLEKKWNMKNGSLSEMNSNLDPKKLKIGQEITTILSKKDLPSNLTLNSKDSMKGMDGFFTPGKRHEGVNNLKYVSNSEFETMTNEVSDKYFGNWSMSDNFTGGGLDMKKYLLNDQSLYSSDTKSWFRNNNSVSEPSVRTLYIYNDIGYNTNEFGNLLFGNVHSKLKTNLALLIIAADVYSVFATGSLDAPNEKRAVDRGYRIFKDPAKSKLKVVKPSEAMNTIFGSKK